MARVVVARGEKSALEISPKPVLHLTDTPHAPKLKAWSGLAE